MARTAHPQASPDGAPGTRSDVLVTGAGPTGLLLAGDLAEAGHDVTLVERRTETTSNLTRSLVVHARTLEQLDARGLADALTARGYPVDRLRLFGHATLDPTRLPTRFPYVLITPQYEVEALLEERARNAGVTFLHGTELLRLEQDAEGVRAYVRETDPQHRRDGAPEGAPGGEPGDAPGGAEAAREAPRGAVRELRARYLVGADGVHSTVRRALGLPFPGRPVLRSIVLADVRLDRAPESPFTVAADEDAFALIGTFGGGWYRVMGWNRHIQLPDTVPADLAEVREAARRALGSDYGMHDPRWISRFHSDERQAPAYQVGRVFLTGDAAHVHSPAGGMGMNTGLQDAANLSWKLSAVLSGRSPASLLETYQSERHPVGTQVLRVSGTLVRTALMHHPASRALRTAAAELVNRARPLADRAVRTISGIGISYPAPRGAHPLAGKRAPDLALRTGRLYEALRAGTFVLVTDEETATAAQAADEHRVRHVTLRNPSPRNAGRVLLVRPDGYLAWAADRPEPQQLRHALDAWTGPAVRTGSATPA